MRKLILLLCLLVSTPCHAFESGKWISEKSENGFQGELEINIGSNGVVEVSKIEFGIPDPGYLDEGCSITGGEGQIVNNGEMIEVRSHGALSFTIVEHPENYLQVIPHLTVNDLTCKKTSIPEWVRSYPNRDDMEAEISELKWRKVEEPTPR